MSVDQIGEVQELNKERINSIKLLETGKYGTYHSDLSLKVFVRDLAFF
jgi:hypothetical protein